MTDAVTVIDNHIMKVAQVDVGVSYITIVKLKVPTTLGKTACSV